jgi:hypothetical protein
MCLIMTGRNNKQQANKETKMMTEQGLFSHQQILTWFGLRRLYLEKITKNKETFEETKLSLTELTEITLDLEDILNAIISAAEDIYE